MSVSSEKFKSLLTDLLPRLYRYARVLTPSAPDADDLLQMTCERALSRYQQWVDKEHLDRWVFTIMSSVWKNELRSRAIRQGKGFVDLETLEEDAHEKISGNILLGQVFTKVMALPENQREVILLIHVEGYAYAEAAGILDIPIGTLMSRLARARSVLADQLDDKVIKNRSTQSLT